MKKYNKYLIISLIAIIIVVLAVTWINNEKSTNNAITPTPSITTIKDPDNYYTIQVPSNWTRMTAYGSETTGLNTKNPKTNKIEITNLLLSKNVGITIQVFERPSNCEVVKKANATIGDLPAYLDEKHTMWSIYTSNTTYTINYFYPGVGVYHNPKRMITSPSQEEMAENKVMINKIISTFIPVDTKPLICN